MKVSEVALPYFWKETAGKRLFHVHIHLIPRYKGDVENPRGGVRGMIPGKQKYEKDQLQFHPDRE